MSLEMTLGPRGNVMNPKVRATNYRFYFCSSFCFVFVVIFCLVCFSMSQAPPVSCWIHTFFSHFPPFIERFRLAHLGYIHLVDNDHGEVPRGLINVRKSINAHTWKRMPIQIFTSSCIHVLGTAAQSHHMLLCVPRTTRCLIFFSESFGTVRCCKIYAVCMDRSSVAPIPFGMVEVDLRVQLLLRAMFQNPLIPLPPSRS